MKLFICSHVIHRSNRSFDVQPQTNSSDKLAPVKVPHSNAFLDLSGDFTAGTVLKVY